MSPTGACPDPAAAATDTRQAMNVLRRSCSEPAPLRRWQSSLQLQRAPHYIKHQLILSCGPSRANIEHHAYGGGLIWIRVAQELEADDAAARFAGRRLEGSHVLQRRSGGRACRRHLLQSRLCLQGELALSMIMCSGSGPRAVILNLANALSKSLADHALQSSRVAVCTSSTM